MKFGKIIALLAGLVLCFSACAVEEETTNEVSLPQLDEMKEGEQIAIIDTNKGQIKLRFFPEYAPKAVENFIGLAKKGYYDGLIFHRVVKDFVIQGGDPTGTGTGGESLWGGKFADEINANLHHIAGAVAMAKSGPDTNGSQFYIVNNQGLTETEVQALEESKAGLDEIVKDPGGKDVKLGELFPERIIDKYIEVGGTPNLDFGYTVFAQVYEGMDTVAAISSVETDGSDRPVEEMIINSITIGTYEK